MKLVKTSPFNELGFWNQPLDRFFNNSDFNTRKPELWSPRVDIIDTKNNVVINVELPGMKKEAININIEDRVLTISGERNFEESNENQEKKETYYRRERQYGSFKRAFTLSENILIDDVSADYTDGILSVKLKKDIEKEAVKQITIN